MTIAARPSIKVGCLMVREKVVLTEVPANIFSKPVYSETAPFIGASSAKSSSLHIFSLGLLE